MDKIDSSQKRINICLFSFKGANSEKYRELLNKFNVRVIEVENYEYCQVILQSVKCNGILIDIPTYIKSPIHVKEFMSDLEVVYPTARIRYHKETDEVELVILSEKSLVSLQEFLEKYCKCFDGRSLRKNRRAALNLNLRLFWEIEGGMSEFLCTSANISEDGLFVVARTVELPMMAKVKIQILELGKDKFLYGTVIRALTWGEKHFHAPGFGIRIDHIDNDIHKDYIGLIKKHL